MANIRDFSWFLLIFALTQVIFTTQIRWSNLYPCKKLQGVWSKVAKGNEQIKKVGKEWQIPSFLPIFWNILTFASAIKREVTRFSPKLACILVAPYPVLYQNFNSCCLSFLAHCPSISFCYHHYLKNFVFLNVQKNVNTRFSPISVGPWWREWEADSLFSEACNHSLCYLGNN